MNQVHELLTAFGYDERTTRLLATAATKHGLTADHVAGWIEEAKNSHLLNNPPGFVRAKIQNGDKPPSPASREHHHDPRRQSRKARHRYLTQFPAYCPRCNNSPCVCAWVQEQESLYDFLLRTYN